MTLPTIKDFTVAEKPEDDLDGFHAWKNFGGLTMEVAYIKFCENPDCYQEDFMWMGPRAFAFYFPVINRFIREEECAVEFDEITWILAYSIKMHFRSNEPVVQALSNQLLLLCDFVLESLRALPDQDDRSRTVQEVADAWRDVRAQIACEGLGPRA